MQEYNWRKEREKYRPDFMKQPEQPPAPPPVKRPNPNVIAAIIVAVVIAAILAGAGYFRYGRPSSAADARGEVSPPSPGGSGQITDGTVPEKPNVKGDAATMLARAAENKKHAVGLVVLMLKLKNGSKVPIPIGTAWAFSPDKFATNAHVAIGLRETSVNAVKMLAVSILRNKMKDSGAGENVEDFLKKLDPQQRKAIVSQCMAEAQAVIDGFEAAILINGAPHKSHPVKFVQIHRDFGGASSKFHPDVAVLTIDGNTDVFFQTANNNTLAALKSGEPIAFLGFPMENLSNNNVNMENPVASMQSGIVVAVTDFEMKNAGAAGNYLIRHNLPSTGGASGSPIFNRNGEVVALLFAGNIIGQVQNGKVERAPSAAQINFAVRADLLRGMGDPIDIREFLAR